MQSLSDILQQCAIKYNRLGMSVHPVGFGGKNPLVDEWQQPPRLSIDDLKLCFEKRGDIITGLGFCAGFMSDNLCVLDFDSDWQNSLDHFSHSWPELTNTAMCSTAHDRRQVALRIAGLPDSQTVTKFQRGNAIIELRGNACNCVLPPSFHSKCNRSYCTGDNYYEWLTDSDNLEFCEVEYSNLFDWLSDWGEVVEDSKKAIPENPVPIGNIDKMVAAQEVPKAIENAQKMIQNAQDGNKHFALLKASGLLGGYVAVGVLERDRAADILKEEIDKKPNVDDYKLAYKTIDSGLTWGEKRPFTAEKILTDKAEYAHSKNGNDTGIFVQLPKVKVEGDEPEAQQVTFKPWQWSEFLTRPPKKWHIKNVIGPGDIVVMAGDSGSGKTALVLDLAMCGVLGTQYADRFDIAQTLKIAYCTAEGIGNLPARVKAAKEQHSVPMAVIESQFFGYDGPIIPQFFLSPDSEYSIEQFERDLQTLSLQLNLLVVDTLALAAINGNLEDNTDMTKALIRARQFTNRTGIAVLFTHHNNREGTFRGAASLRDNSDGLFVARYDKERDERKLLCKDDKWGKLKDGEEWPGLLYTLETHSVEPAPIVKWLGDYVSGQQNHKDICRDILELFTTMDTELKGENIQAALGDLYNPGSIKNGLTKLVKEKKLTRFYDEPDKPASKTNRPNFKKTIRAL